MRLNRFLALCGVSSRRAADDLIAEGKVTIDGRRASLGETVKASSDVKVNGKRIHLPTAGHVTIVLNKPRGVVTTMYDDRGRKSVRDYLPKASRRLFPIGRLDAETTGLLLCTSDGALARFLMHPSSEVPRRYEVIASGKLSPETVRFLSAKDVRRLADGAHSFSLILREGKNRQVRRLCGAAGLQVIALRRTQFGPVRLGELRLGATRVLTKAEFQALTNMQQGKR